MEELKKSLCNRFAMLKMEWLVSYRVFGLLPRKGVARHIMVWSVVGGWHQVKPPKHKLRSLGIPLRQWMSIDSIDVTVDGADSRPSTLWD